MDILFGGEMFFLFGFFFVCEIEFTKAQLLKLVFKQGTLAFRKQNKTKNNPGRVNKM